MVIDCETGEVGILSRRWCIIPDGPVEDYEGSVNLWAWDIYWTGNDSSQLTNDKRYQPFTENGLLNMIKGGAFRLVPPVEK